MATEKKLDSHYIEIKDGNKTCQLYKYSGIYSLQYYVFPDKDKKQINIFNNSIKELYFNTFKHMLFKSSKEETLLKTFDNIKNDYYINASQKRQLLSQHKGFVKYNETKDIYICALPNRKKQLNIQFVHLDNGKFEIFEYARTPKRLNINDILQPQLNTLIDCTNYLSIICLFYDYMCEDFYDTKAKVKSQKFLKYTASQVKTNNVKTMMLDENKIAHIIDIKPDYNSMILTIDNLKYTFAAQITQVCEMLCKNERHFSLDNNSIDTLLTQCNYYFK